MKTKPVVGIFIAAVIIGIVLFFAYSFFPTQSAQNKATTAKNNEVASPQTPSTSSLSSEEQCKSLESNYNKLITQSDQTTCTTNDDCLHIEESLYEPTCNGLSVAKAIDTNSLINIIHDFKQKNCTQLLYPNRQSGCNSAVASSGCYNNKCSFSFSSGPY